MPAPDSDAARWAEARAIAAELAETGVDPLDADAARAARTALLRRFALDLLMIFAIVAVVGAVGLMVARAIGGEDPLDGREIWIASGALFAVLLVVAARSFFGASARAYEAAWRAFVDRVWPGAPKGDDFGTARLAFVRRAAAEAPGAFPSAAPGRKV